MHYCFVLGIQDSIWCWLRRKRELLGAGGGGGLKVKDLKINDLAFGIRGFHSMVRGMRPGSRTRDKMEIFCFVFQAVIGSMFVFCFGEKSGSACRFLGWGRRTKWFFRPRDYSWNFAVSNEEKLFWRRDIINAPRNMSVLPIILIRMHSSLPLLGKLAYFRHPTLFDNLSPELRLSHPKKFRKARPKPQADEAMPTLHL